MQIFKQISAATVYVRPIYSFLWVIHTNLYIQ